MLFDSCGDYVFYDGAMGTMLQKSGSRPGERPDILNITAPHIVEDVHRSYVSAGSNIVCANTFGANAIALAGTGYSPEEIISAGVRIAKRACDGGAKVALDIGPTGQLLEPMGDLEFDRAIEIFAEQAIAGERAGADYAAIETMSDLTEIKAAIIAVVENTALPVLASMTFDKTGCTFLGFTPEEFAQAAQSLGAAAVGLNCSLEPAEMYETAERIAKTTNLPLIIKPNAGLPDSLTGQYSIDPEEFAKQMIWFKKLKARPEKTENEKLKMESGGLRGADNLQSSVSDCRLLIVGGCCGTTPEYVRAIKRAFLGDAQRI